MALLRQELDGHVFVTCEQVLRVMDCFEVGACRKDGAAGLSHSLHCPPPHTSPTLKPPPRTHLHPHFIHYQAPPQRVEVLVIFYSLIVDRSGIGAVLGALGPFEQVGRNGMHGGGAGCTGAL